MHLAAVDIGTNTVRLLVADVVDGTLRDVLRRTTITRLGQGVDATKRLHPDAIGRTVDAVAAFVVDARSSGAEAIRLAGTSVLRDATDRESFVDVVRERVGLDVDVLSGGEEGRLAHLGATKELHDGPYVVCDIGGGSTELSTADVATSIDVGSVRLKERILRHDPPTADEIESATTVIADLLAGVDLPEGLHLVGVAATITTIAALVLGLDAYDRDTIHGSVISRDDVRACGERLLSMRADDIAAIGPVERGRADVIASGSLILTSVMERWGYPHVLVSERDILDGLVWDLAQRVA